MRELHVSGHHVPPGVGLALLLPICALFLIGTAQKAVESYGMARQVEEVRKDVAELRQRNLELQARIARYRSDAFVEKVAREELNMVRPGDVPVIIVGPTPMPVQALPPAAPTPTGPTLRQWLRLFIDER